MKKKQKILLIIIITILFSTLIISQMIPEKQKNCEEGEAIILTAPKGAMGFGHTALLIKDGDEWKYFSWQAKKVVYTTVPTHAMKDLDAFNEWIKKNNTIQSYIANFTSALKIKGDFKESLKKSEEMFNEYIKKQNQEKENLNYSELKLNTEYNFMFNNCVKVIYDILKESKVQCGRKFKELVNKPSIISNVAKKQFKTQLQTKEFFQQRI